MSAKDQRIFVHRPLEQLPPGADHLIRRSCSVPGTKQFRVGDVQQMVDSIADVEQRFASRRDAQCPALGPRPKMA